MTCNCGSPPKHKVWCAERARIRAQRVAARKAERAEPKRRDPRGRPRALTYEEMLERRRSAARLYDAGVSGIVGGGP